MSKKILIIEDDADIAAIEKDYLEVSGYDVEISDNGSDGMRAALNGNFDLIILDIMLPGMNGFDVCKNIRGKIDIPIMMLTARKSDIDKIKGLGFGADDYIEKPFSPSVFVARVKSRLAQYERLKGSADANKIILGNITLESDTHRVFVDEKEIVLPNKEFQLLEFLMTNANIVFNRETLYDRIWGMNSFGNTATVPVHINRLRDAVELDPAKPKHLITVWGVGYKFKP
ncbi:MAG: response regulator transcription factor [Selenomonadaceae bacterium]|nr:response regulator transcription factor [Selenomonadaceae bacterium]MBQ3727554.1 response regulator transcription factor [Selenomonadaceae bacterium]MBQ9495969.1 response regulator transcription factor [Selenomonadaceae bacterium]